MKSIKYYQMDTLQEDETYSQMVIDVVKTENFPYRIFLEINVDGKKHIIKPNQLKRLIDDFNENEKLNKEIYEKNI